MQLLHELDSLVAVAGLSDHLHVRLGADNHGEPDAHELLIVRDDYTDMLLLIHDLHCIR